MAQTILTSVRVSAEARDLWQQIAEATGIPRTRVLEMLIREEATRRRLKPRIMAPARKSPKVHKQSAENTA